MKVTIVGATGYSGLELVRLLQNHPKVEIAMVVAQQNVGQRLSDVYPLLRGICDLPLQAFNPTRIMEESQAVLLATPAGFASQHVQAFSDAAFPVVDLSGDFRLKEAGVYEKWYQKPAASQKLVEQARYGLVEWVPQKEQTLIANPGCYATATLLGFAPVAQAGLMDPDFVVVDAKSGISGAGKKADLAYSFTHLQDNLQVYKVNQHQHIPEILQQLQAWQPDVTKMQFTTSLVPLSRGIMSNLYFRLNKKISEAALYELYSQAYQEHPLVRVLPYGDFPDLSHVRGTCYCDIGLQYNPVTEMVFVVTVIDNLGKGAAGQAIQNLNGLFGFPTSLGLEVSAVYP